MVAIASGAQGDVSQRDTSIQRNHLLSILSPADLNLLKPFLEAVKLAHRQVLEEARNPIEHVYFPEDGLISVIAYNKTEREIAVGLIGREGMTGTAVVMGDDRSPHRAFVQVAGQAQRLKSNALREAMQKSATLHRCFLLFAYTLSVQTAQTALSNSHATVEQRLAHWLLMAHDRLDGEEIQLTHDLLAMILGVRRAGITEALQVLEREALISTARSLIVVQDRAGLEKVADGLYGVSEGELQRLTGWKPIRPTSGEHDNLERHKQEP